MHVKTISRYNEILPRLYLGDIFTIRNRDEFAKLGITHIITIDLEALRINDSAVRQKQLFINAMDHTRQDILSHFNRASEFIETALSELENKVYVHCVAGISRSASIVIAFVMKSRKITFMEAFNLVHEKRQVVKPNEGFIQQLVLYHEMKYSIDITNRKYRKIVFESMELEFKRLSARAITHSSSIWHYVKQQSTVQVGRSLVLDIFRTYYNKLHLSEVSGYPMLYNPDNAFRCNKCHVILFYPISVIVSKLSAGGTDDMLAPVDLSRGSSIMPPAKLPAEYPFFSIEPQPWMDSDVLDSDGVLRCYRCGQVVGEFDWKASMSYNCDMHNNDSNLVPFKIQRAKVDFGQSPRSESLTTPCLSERVRTVQIKRRVSIIDGEVPYGIKRLELDMTPPAGPTNLPVTPIEQQVERKLPNRPTQQVELASSSEIHIIQLRSAASNLVDCTNHLSSILSTLSGLLILMEAGLSKPKRDPNNNM